MGKSVWESIKKELLEDSKFAKEVAEHKQYYEELKKLIEIVIEKDREIESLLYEKQKLWSALDGICSREWWWAKNENIRKLLNETREKWRM